MSDRGRVRLARMQEIDRVAALWALITEHHAALDPLFRMRRGPVAEGEPRPEGAELAVAVAVKGLLMGWS